MPVIQPSVKRVISVKPDEIPYTVNAFEKEGVPDWQCERLQDAGQVEAGFGDSFIAIPSEGSLEGYRDMEDFIATVRNRRVQERLERAISGLVAFRYLKDLLLDYPLSASVGSSSSESGCTNGFTTG